MDMFAIRGGVPLRGTAVVSGAKNAALPIMAAALAATGPTLLQDVPDLADVRTLCKLLSELGMHVEQNDDGEMQLTVVDTTPYVADYDLVRTMRASVCVLGPLLARRGRACISLPGGCNIGDRPIDLHLKGLAALGAQIRVERGYVIAQAKELRGARIYLGGPFGCTVTGTCNVMVAAALARGTTIIEAAACEPEVVDLGNYLNKMGARINGLGTPLLEIEGVEELTGTTHRIIPDRIEAATLMIAAAATQGDVELENVRTQHLTAVLEKLADIGVHFSDAGQDRLRVSNGRKLSAADCAALPSPGIPTDVQAQLMSLLVGSPGISVITDKVFPDRFMHAAELARMGAVIRREGPSAIISGVGRLSGATVMASDLRASAALVIAGLAAEGDTAIRRIYHLDRGYERLELKLRNLGANIERVDDRSNAFPHSFRLDRAETGEELGGPHWPQHESAEKRSKRSA